jgi:hypothetical protein
MGKVLLPLLTYNTTHWAGLSTVSLFETSQFADGLMDTPGFNNFTVPAKTAGLGLAWDRHGNNDKNGCSCFYQVTYRYYGSAPASGTLDIKLVMSKN